MEYLYGENKNIEEHEHIHEHIEEHEHVHTHRGVKEIFSILQKGQFSERAKELAEKIFLILAEAEGKAHGVSADKVHFHEIGALDSIMDVIAATICMDNLDITKVVILQINEGQGQIRC